MERKPDLQFTMPLTPEIRKQVAKLPYDRIHIVYLLERGCGTGFFNKDGLADFLNKNSGGGRIKKVMIYPDQH